MKAALRSLYILFITFGFDPRKMVLSARGLPTYLRNLRLLRQQAPVLQSEFPFGRWYPCLDDRFSDSGSTKGHYFHQDLLVARRIHLNNPIQHLDVGSRIDGFVAHVASFRRIAVMDIRPLSICIPNMEFVQADLMSKITSSMTESCDSLSCLHAIEHFGLGRYGDTIKYDGHLLGMENLYRILKSGGKFYLSTPIGPQRIEFDAHRVFSVKYLLEQFNGKYRLDYFSFVDDKGELHEDVSLNEKDVLNNFGCVYGCGIFELTKL